MLADGLDARAASRSSQYVTRQVDTAAFPHRSEGVGVLASSTIGTGWPLVDVRLDQTPRARGRTPAPVLLHRRPRGNLVVMRSTQHDRIEKSARDLRLHRCSGDIAPLDGCHARSLRLARASSDPGSKRTGTPPLRDWRKRRPWDSRRLAPSFNPSVRARASFQRGGASWEAGAPLACVLSWGGGLRRRDSSTSRFAGSCAAPSRVRDIPRCLVSP